MVEQSRPRLAGSRRCTWLVVSLAAMLASACASLDADKLAVGAVASEADTPAAAPDRKATGKIADLARASAAHPRDPKLAISYARGLKQDGRLKDALTVLETASAAQAPGKPNRAVQLERGLLALELGQTVQAQQLLASVNDPKARDWRVLSGLGVASATLGQQAEAQRYFQSALELAPNNAAVLNNLALSYMLDRKIDRAEQLLRRAAKGGDSRPRVAQNLALAVSLRTPRGDGEAAGTVISQAPRTDGAPPMGLTKTLSSGIGGTGKDGDR